MTIRRFLSLGAGVQSTTLALMASRGDIEPVECAIFADTGWEPEAVYRHLDWLETQLSFPIIRVKRAGPDLGELCLEVARGERTIEGSSLAPFFTDGPLGMMQKQCSKEFKTRVIGQEVRRRVGLSPGQRGPKHIVVHQLIGMSYDEMERMKDAEAPWTLNVFPLVDMRIRRRDCLKWMEDRQYPRPPRSSCIFCPYRTDAEHRDLRDNAAPDWKRLKAFDTGIRTLVSRGSAYVHRQRVPIGDADISSAAERGQKEFGFLEECDGVCGV